MNKLILSILVCFILLVPTKSYSMDGNKWLELCKLKFSRGQDVGFLSCSSYLAGLRDMKIYADSYNKYIVKFFKKERDEFNEKSLNTLRELFEVINLCIPKNVSSRQLTKVMTQWLEQHPERLHKEMNDSFFDAMKESFPCKN